MKLTRLFTILCLLSLWATPIAMAYKSPPPVQEDNAAPGMTQYTLPVGTPFFVLLQNPIHTQVNQAGDTIEGELAQNVYLYDKLLLSKNTRFKGVISRVEPPLEGRNAILQVRFTDLILENHQVLPISSYVMTSLPDHTWGGELTPGTKPKKITHKVWGIGEYNQIVMQGPRAMGHHIEILPGERWTVILDKPLVLMSQNP